MNEPQHKNAPQTQSDDPREISKWARRYTQSRTIPFLTSLAFFVFFTIAIGVSSYLSALAYRAGRMVWFWICIVLLVSTLAALIWYIICADRLIRSMSARVYRNEGSTSLDSSLTKKQKVLVGTVVSVFLLCVLAAARIGISANLPRKYMQPVSAIYCVPFLVFMSILLRRRISLLSLLWPMLYALHAILVVAGVPIPCQRTGLRSQHDYPVGRLWHGGWTCGSHLQPLCFAEVEEARKGTVTGRVSAGKQAE